MSIFSPTVSHGRPRAAALALVIGFVLQMFFLVSYVGALHNPDRMPTNMPFGVAGPAAVTTRYEAALRATAGNAFQITRYPDAGAALDAVMHRDVYGALAPTATGGSQLTVADAAGTNVASSLAQSIGAAFLKAGQSLRIVHVAKLPSGDPKGLSPFYAALSWVFGAYLGAIVLSVLAGAATSRHILAWQRLGGLGLYAIVSGIVGAILLDPVLGAISGHFVAVAALGALIVFSVCALTLGLEATFGLAGTAVALILFLILSNPSSGGPIVGPVLPGFWRVIGPWLPTGAGTSAIRNTLYFDGAHLLQPLLLLTGFAIVGVGLTLAAARRLGEGRRGIVRPAQSAGTQ